MFPEKALIAFQDSLHELKETKVHQRGKSVWAYLPGLSIAFLEEERPEAPCRNRCKDLSSTWIWCSAASFTRLWALPACFLLNFGCSLVIVINNYFSGRIFKSAANTKTRQVYWVIELSALAAPLMMLWGSAAQSVYSEDEFPLRWSKWSLLYFSWETLWEPYRYWN